eukprot:285662_1
MATRFNDPERAQRECDRRAREADVRRARIHDDKARLIGVDLAAFDGQVTELADRQAKARQHELDEDRKRMEFTRKSILDEQTVTAVRKSHSLSVADFQKSQNKRDRTTWDICDPDAIKNSSLPIGEAAEASAPLSSLQKFAGEDHTRDTRTHAQHLQQMHWANEQLCEKAASKKLERQSDKAYSSFVDRMDKMSLEKVSKRDVNRKKYAKDVQEYNLKMAQLRKDKEKDETIVEKQKSDLEVELQKKSAFLNEDMETTFRFGSNHSRRIPYHMKGFSAEEYQKIRDSQAVQRKGIESVRDTARDEDRAWAKKEEEFRRALMVRDLAKARAHSYGTAQVKSENVAQKMEKDERDDKYKYDAIMKPAATEEYFRGYGTSDR